MAHQTKYLTLLAYAAVYIGWGTTYLAIRIGVDSTAPATFLALRFLIAAAALIPLMVVTKSWKRQSNRQIRDSVIQGIMLLVGGLLPIAYAERSLPSNVTAVVIGCAPIGFTFFEALLNRSRLRWTALVGLALGVLGGVTLSFEGALHSSSSVSTPQLAMVVLGCVIWSFASVSSKKLDPARPALMNVFIQYVASSIVLIVIALLFEKASPATLAQISVEGWKSAIYLALIPSIISYTAYIWLIAVEPSSRVATYAFVNPIVAVICGALILDENTSALTIASLMLTIAGVWLSFKKSKLLSKMDSK